MGDTPFQARVAAAAITGEYLHAVWSGHDAAGHSPRVKDFLALETAVDGHQHLLERLQFEAAQTIAQHVIPEGSIHPDPKSFVHGGPSHFHLGLVLPSW